MLPKEIDVEEELILEMISRRTHGKKEQEEKATERMLIRMLDPGSRPMQTLFAEHEMRLRATDRPESL